MRTFLLTGAALGLLVTQSGCAFRTGTTRMAVDHNEFVSQATNRQTVVNILRARDRAPMHFTSLSVVRGTVRGTGNAEVGASFPNDTAVDVVKQTVRRSMAPAGTTDETIDEETTTTNRNDRTLTPKVGVQITTGTDFDVAVNATDEFYKGILTPVRDSLVVHYLRQGFPPDLLSHLLIRQLRFYAVFKRSDLEIDQAGLPIPKEVEPGAVDRPRRYGDVLIAEINNSPDDYDQSKLFGMAMACRTLDYVSETREKRTVSFSSLADLSGLTPEVMDRVKSTVDQPFSYDVKGGTDFKLALSERARCEGIARELNAYATPAVNQLVKDIDALLRKERSAALGMEDLKEDQARARASASTPAPQAFQPRLPGAKFLSRLSRPLPERSGGASVADAPPGPEQPDKRSGTLQFENEGYFNDLLVARGLLVRQQVDKSTVLVGYTGDLVIEMTLRSPEGVLYYLGEYLRNAETSQKLFSKEAGCPNEVRLSPTGGSPQEPVPCLPILVVGEGRLSGGETLLEVEYRRRTHSVPLSGKELRASAGRSSQTLALVQQLLNLHRSSKDLPSTPVVRIIN